MKNVTKIVGIVVAIAIAIVIVKTIIAVSNELNNKTEDAVNTTVGALNKMRENMGITGEIITWQDNENGTFTRDGITVSIGDTVDYTAKGYSENWCVLGVDEGCLLLVMQNGVGNVTLEGKEGYNNGVSKLNTRCEKYLNTDYASYVRSINIKDIEKIIKYDKTTYGLGKTYKYGNNVTYKINNDGYVTYSSKTESGTSMYTKFETINGILLTAEDEGITVTNTYYSFPEITENSAINNSGYNLIFKNSSGENQTYWLASPYIYANEGYVNWGMHCVFNSGVGGNFLCYSNGSPNSTKNAVRAVVYLNQDILLETNGKNSWKINI